MQLKCNTDRYLYSLKNLAKFYPKFNQHGGSYVSDQLWGKHYQFHNLPIIGQIELPISLPISRLPNHTAQHNIPNYYHNKGYKDNDWVMKLGKLFTQQIDQGYCPIITHLEIGIDQTGQNCWS